MPYIGITRAMSLPHARFRNLSLWSPESAVVVPLQWRPDPALGGPELRDTFIMALTQRAVLPLRRLGVRLPEGDWLGDLAPGLGTVVYDPDGQVRDNHPPGATARGRA